jgi:hypothetical protein
MEVRMNKIIEEGVLYEDDEDDQEGEEEQFDWQFEESEAEELEGMLHVKPVDDSDEGEERLLVSEEEASES